VLNNGGTKLMAEIKNKLKKMSQTSILSTKTLSVEQGKYLSMLILIF
jgi:hypothetical protein